MTNSQILTRAKTALHNAQYPPRKLSALHAGITAAVTLLFALTTHLLTDSMDAASGLAGLDTRTLLRFVQTVLMITLSTALPFWELGYLRAALLQSRGEAAKPAHLLHGFRRFFPALTLMVVRLLAVSAMMYFTLTLSLFLFVMSPFGAGLFQAIANLPAQTPEHLETLLPKLLPVYAIWAVLMIGAVTVLYYRFRLSDLAVMDGYGPFASLKQSLRRTKGRALQLLRLDLRFWWYYLALALCVVVSYLDFFLPALGIRIDPELSFWLFTVLGQLGTWTVLTLFNPLVQTAYALFFLIENECVAKGDTITINY